MRSNTVGWLLLAPTLLILGLFGIVPFIYVLYVAFHQWNPFGANPKHGLHRGRQFPPARLRRRVPLLDLR